MNQSMNSLMNKLNDMYLDLDILLSDFDEVLVNTVEIETYWEDETGKHRGVINTYDEDGINELKKIYERLERIING